VRDHRYRESKRAKSSTKGASAAIDVHVVARRCYIRSMFRQREPIELGKLRATLRWREPMRLADVVMCAGLAALFAALATEYVLTRTFAFHLRDIAPMLAAVALAVLVARPATNTGYVGELGVATTSSSIFGTSCRLLMFHHAPRVDVTRRQGKVTFVWFGADDALMFELEAPEAAGDRVGFGYAAVDAFREYQLRARASAAPKRARAGRTRASAHYQTPVHRSHSTRPRRSAVRSRRYRDPA
jgi:hypothetical protein